MSEFAPTTNQVIAVLERQARAIAEKLGHTWSGIAPGAKSGDFATFCTKCFDWCHISPRSFARAPIRGEMVTFECRAGLSE